MDTKIKVIEIDQQGKFIKKNTKLFYLGCGKNIRFVYLGNFKIDQSMYLLTNLQNENNKKTQVNDINILNDMSFEQFQLQYNLLEGNFEEQLFWSTEVIFNEPGSFTFQLVIVKDEQQDQKQKNVLSHQSLDDTTQFYKKVNIFNISTEINTILVYKPYKNNQTGVKYRRHDFINLLTLYPAMLGPFEKWEQKIQEFINRGYRGFHFTPIQNLGPSQSAYCIQDFKKFNKNVFYKQQNQTQDLIDLFNKFKKNHDCFFMVDILFNHCSIDCASILENPDATFNTKNTPQLNAAYVLDKELQKYNEMLINFKTFIRNEEDIQKITDDIQKNLLPKLNIEDYFMIDVQNVLNELIQYYTKQKGERFAQDVQKNNHGINFVTKNNFQAIQNCFYNYGSKPFGVEVDIKKLAENIDQTFYYLNILEVKKILNEINKKFKTKVEKWNQDIIQALKGSIKYYFLEKQNYEVTKQNKIAHEYFLDYKDLKIAKNGWIMDYNNEEDFILNQDQFYLRRQIVIWEDLVKIRYIQQDEKSFIWQYMEDYIIQMAKIFDGFRFDNFHNTDLNSAKYFIKQAYKHNKYLFNISELFVPDESKAIRLCEQASVHRMVQEVKAFEDPDQLDKALERNSRRYLNYFNLNDQGNKKYLTPLYKAIYPKKIIYDQTHDNPTLYQIDKIRIQLPLLAVISFLGEMTGTTFGFDEMLINQIPVTCQDKYPQIMNNIVDVSKEDNYVLFTIDKEDFEYQINENIYKIEIKGSFDDWGQGHVIRYNEQNQFWDWLCLKPGKYYYKYLINDKYWMINKYLDNQQDNNGNRNNCITVQKNDMQMHENFIDFRRYFNGVHEQQKNNFKIQIRRRGDIFLIRRYRQDFQICQKLIARYNTQKVGSKNFDIVLDGKISSFAKIGFMDENFDIVDKDKKFPRIKARIYETSNIQHYANTKNQDENYKTKLCFKNIPGNFICLMNCKEDEYTIKNLKFLEKQLDPKSGFLSQIYCKVSLEDINYFLYSCENEEQEKYQRGTFYIPDYGKLVFAGFAGLKKILVQTAIDINKHHPVFNMIVENDYLIDYYMLRVKTYNCSKFDIFKQKFCEICQNIKNLPRFLIPPQFQKLIFVVIEFFEEKFLSMINLRDGLKKNYFFQNLILSIPQFLTKHQDDLYLSSAGLPHFSTGIWKNWGRDTFISFKGIFIVPKLFEQGKQILLHYAKFIRHGLVPNLLSPSRYNARDATWWFIKAVKDYLEATNDYKILTKKILMEYQSDDQKIHEDLKQKNHQKKMQFIEILQMIFQKHAKGIKFKEWNASKIDDHMREIGFNINLYVDWNCGFIFGGNSSNCLTWMDKMGSSEKANNKGVPGSPRYGSPVELTSLLYLGLKLMNMLYEEGFSQYEGVETNQSKCITYSQWKILIAQNFQKHYWIPLKEEEFDNYKIEQAFVLRKGIIKDCYSNNKHDYMLRPNALIAVALTPKLIDHDKSISYLNHVTNHLLKRKSIGVKTLDPYESIYHANYNNNDESDNFYTAKGFNYHNGPEWVWLYGYYLMAVNRLEERCTDITLKQINRVRNHLKIIQQSDWLSLPELTNDNGSFCKDSCQSQLWSIACMLQAFDCVYEQLKIFNNLTYIVCQKCKKRVSKYCSVLSILITKNKMQKVSQKEIPLTQIYQCLCNANNLDNLLESSSSKKQRNKKVTFICKQCYQVLCQYCIKQHEQHIDEIEMVEELLKDQQIDEYDISQYYYNKFERQLDNMYDCIKYGFIREMNMVKQQLMEIDIEQIESNEILDDIKNSDQCSQDQIFQYIQIKDKIQKTVHENFIFEKQNLQNSVENLLYQEVFIDKQNFRDARYYSKYLHWFCWSQNTLNILNVENFRLQTYTTNKEFVIPSFSRSIMTNDGFLYLIGGEYKVSQGATNHVFQTSLNTILKQKNTTNHFSFVQKSSMSYKKFDFCSILVDGFIYVFGGKDKNRYAVDTAEKYDIKNDRWYVLKSSEIKRFSATACKSPRSQQIFIFGGRLSYNKILVKEIDCYDILEDDWSQLCLVPTKWKPLELSCVIAMNDNDILIFGGSNKDISDTQNVYIYDMYQMEINKQKNMPKALIYITQPILYNKKVYVIGSEYNTKTKKVVTYDIKNKKWLISQDLKLYQQLTYNKHTNSQINQIEQCKKSIAKTVKKTLMIHIVYQELYLNAVILSVNNVWSNQLKRHKQHALKIHQLFSLKKTNLLKTFLPTEFYQNLFKTASMNSKIKNYVVIIIKKKNQYVQQTIVQFVLNVLYLDNIEIMNSKKRKNSLIIIKTKFQNYSMIYKIQKMIGQTFSQKMKKKYQTKCFSNWTLQENNV